ncbi:hypothetical protein D3C80_1035330 [compost metagenome]
MHLNANHDHFQLVHWQAQSDLQDPNLLLKACDKSNLSYTAVQITIVPSDNTLAYRSQIHDPNRLTDPIFLTGHACTRCFQRSILQVQLGVQSLHFQQADQKHPNPSVAGQFHL